MNDGLLTRRGLLKGAGVACGAWLLPRSLARAKGVASKGEVPSVLVDLSRCIGCRACQRACQRANRLSAEDDLAPISQTRALAYDRWTVVNAEGRPPAVRPVKRQCMHCLEPACASVCPVGALSQTEQGPVVYRPDRCIGCRYCMVACPFDVPRFQWDSGLTPVIGKCQFCAQERLFRGLLPACAEACPTGALRFGKRSDLLYEAHARIKGRSDRYVDHVYGAEELGGTSWLYISDVPFEELGFKQGLPKRPLPSLTWDIVSKIPALALALAVLFGMLATTLRNPREEEAL